MRPRIITALRGEQGRETMEWIGVGVAVTAAILIVFTLRLLLVDLIP